MKRLVGLSKKMPVALTLITLLLAGSKVAIGSQLAGADPGPAPIGFGYVCSAALSAFSPDSASIPLHAIRTLQFDAAYGPLLYQYSRNPYSFGLIAGLLQASIGEPSPNFLTETLQQLESQNEQQLNIPDRFRLATALYYDWSCAWPHSDVKLLRRSQRILSELWQTYHDPVDGLMLAETALNGGRATDPSVHIDITAIHEQVICSLITPVAAEQFKAASQDGWKGDPPDLDQVPIVNRKRLMCAVQSLYWLNIGVSRIGKVQNGKVVWTTVPFTPEQQQIQDYLKPWLIALGSATGLKYVLAS